MRKFDSIMIANRGEIALRVIRTAKALGYKTIAVYSEVDAHAPHVAVADDAICIGPGPVSESYLNIARLLDAARKSGAQAIHPGYGFLSENAAFAREVESAGLTFIGPTPEAIDLMGNKAAAKRRMMAAGVPCVPGYEGEDQADAAFVAAAQKIGYPVMVKAAAGGGGRGMRLVTTPKDLSAALRTARSEARNAFGSDELILEKAIQRPRHVEIQVIADQHGTVLHLGERDCSVQRRHQKVVEEAPCPVMTATLRERMGASAVEAARSIGYRGAGTIEFLLDESGEFYFLEMNTRIQVEHPVTELVTGLDIVTLQIAVAEGRTLDMRQSDVRLNGHAIEVRLYAEDPGNDFLPVTGTILHWTPAQGEGVRIDSGIVSGQEISPHYDPMLAKIIAWGQTRDDALARLITAVSSSELFGLKSNKSFLAEILMHPAFRRGEVTTAFLGENPTLGAAVAPAAEVMAGATVLQFRAERERMHDKAIVQRSELLDWSSGKRAVWRCAYDSTPGIETEIVVSPRGQAAYEVTLGDDQFNVFVVTHTALHAVCDRNEHPPDGKLHAPGRSVTVKCKVPSNDRPCASAT